MNSCCNKKKQITVVKKTKHIIEGWSNLITNKYKHTPFVKSRAEICSRCKELNKMNKFCKICGCFIPAKITVKKEKCPVGYWDKVV